MSVLREIREAADLSARALSEKLGRPHNYVTLVETGQRLQNTCEFFAHIEACGADPVEVVRRVTTLNKLRRGRTQRGS